MNLYLGRWLNPRIKGGPSWKSKFALLFTVCYVCSAFWPDASRSSGTPYTPYSNRLHIKDTLLTKLAACWQAHRKRLDAAFLSILLSRDKFPFIGSLPAVGILMSDTSILWRLHMPDPLSSLKPATEHTFQRAFFGAEAVITVIRPCVSYLPRRQEE